MTNSALKELVALPSEVAGRIEARLPGLAFDPRRKRPGMDILPLRGRARFWRLRVGDYRVIYCVQENEVWVTEIGHRSTVYL